MAKKTSGWRAVIFLLGSFAALMACSVPGASADLPVDEVPPGIFEMIIILLLTIVGFIAIFALLRRGGVRLIRRGQK